MGWGTNLELTRIHKYITNQGYYPFAYYITLDAVDTRNNTPCTFQTCLVEYPLMNGDTVRAIFHKELLAKLDTTLAWSREQEQALKFTGFDGDKHVAENKGKEFDWVVT
ncbi:hypothetical protein Bca52824_001219 [Brassica carinata]|uniref:Uncharacterized protein n=1 Tax=Brassica carinata TaxID=52824 RepID=A0A8X8B9K7_BRACI|nr:hypothetical protein Bca52824_001219 [Brassica carinata]